MRIPRDSLGLVLIIAAASALGAALGGPGGFAIRLRALRARVDAHDDELEQASRRISRREGVAGRQAQQSQDDELRVEAARILGEGGGGRGKRAPRAVPDLPGVDPDAAFVERLLGPRPGIRRAE